MLTPPGPTSRPTMMSTMPQMSWRRMMAKMPATTRITARIHKRVPMGGKYPLAEVANPAERVTAKTDGAPPNGPNG